MGTTQMPLPEGWGGGTVPFPIPVEHGTLWRCPQCRKWWVAGPDPAHGRGLWFGGGGLSWERVRWWNLGLRRRILRYDAEHSYRGPGTYYCDTRTPDVATGPLESPPPLT